MRENIKVGCCGFCLRREKYFEKFNLVELQNTFYQPPQKFSSVEKLRSLAPQHFEFTLKAWQIITHPANLPTYRRLKEDIGKRENYGFFKGSKEVFSAWERIFKIAKILKVKVVVFQTPPSFKENKENIDNLYNFFTKIERDNLKFVWEERANFSYLTLKKICKDLHLIIGVDPFKKKPLDCEFYYFRLHGKGSYNYKYTLKELKELKAILDRPSYILFNNIYMKESALKFKKLLNKDA